MREIAKIKASLARSKRDFQKHKRLFVKAARELVPQVLAEARSWATDLNELVDRLERDGERADLRVKRSAMRFDAFISEIHRYLEVVQDGIAEDKARLARARRPRRPRGKFRSG